MKELLEKTRKISSFVQRVADTESGFADVASSLSEALGAMSYLVDADGLILARGVGGDFECGMFLDTFIRNDKFQPEYAWILRNILHTVTDRDQATSGCIFDRNVACPTEASRHYMIVPLFARGERLGTLILEREGREFDYEDTILAEYAGTVVGMELLRLKTAKIEREARRKVAAEIAVSALSYSELEAVQEIFRQLDNKDGFLVASKVAEELGITRSVIVNALRKLESAGVVESRSLGMKGTYIRVLNPELLEKLGTVS